MKNDKALKLIFEGGRKEGVKNVFFRKFSLTSAPPPLDTFGKLLVTFRRQSRVYKADKHILGCLGNLPPPPFIGKFPYKTISYSLQN